MPHLFVFMALAGFSIFFLMLALFFCPSWLYFSLNPLKIRHTLTCLRHGHKWHEGRDTFRYVIGSENSGFSHGSYTWKCLRCGVATDVCEPPPPNKSWDDLWVNPMERPNWSDGSPGNCAQIYRERMRMKKVRM